MAVFTERTAVPGSAAYLHFGPRIGTAGSRGLPSQTLSSMHGCAWGWSCSWQCPLGPEEPPAQSMTSSSQAGGCVPDPQLATSLGSQASSEQPPGHYSPSFRVHLMSPVLLLTA